MMSHKIEVGGGFEPP